MRAHLLNAIGTLIDSYNTRKTNNMAQYVKNWLDGTYGRYWTVHIYGTSTLTTTYPLISTFVLIVKDTRLGLTIEIAT